MGVIDHQLGDARVTKVLDVPDDQRLAADLEQGFRAVVGQRAHALAAPGGEDHGLHQKV
ncbi:hypothetical protein SDC9_203855 [bioreactor metagenome]|uniref:Uncharacterized protein n=1 Tax=bioreactor metagenome TaxID=1076179 RepID=A0A645J0C4_9ZZZZ